MTRAYQEYWNKLKIARVNKAKIAKIIHIKVPHALMDRVIKAIKKEKDLDWEFKRDNSSDPWRLHHEYKVLEKHKIEGHSICVLSLWIDRRSDLG